MHLLDGKKALVSGVTNQKSIAWGIAQALHSQGAQIAFTCVETNVRRVKKLAPMVASELIIPCDVRNDHEIEELFHTGGGSLWRTTGHPYSLHRLCRSQGSRRGIHTNASGTLGTCVGAAAPIPWSPSRTTLAL